MDGRAAQSEKLAREAVATAQRFLGSAHPQTLKLELALAKSLNDQRQREAVEAMRHCLEKSRKRLGPDHAFPLEVLSEYTVALDDAGQSYEAVAVLKDLLAARTRVLGNSHPETLLTKMNLATELNDFGRQREAEPPFEECLKDYREKFGPKDQRALRAYTNLLLLRGDVGRLREAVALAKPTCLKWKPCSAPATSTHCCSGFVSPARKSPAVIIRPVSKPLSAESRCARPRPSRTMT